MAERNDALKIMLNELIAADFDDRSVLLAGVKGDKTFVHILADDDELDIILMATFAGVCETKNRDPYKLALLCAAYASNAKEIAAIERISRNHDTIRN